MEVQNDQTIIECDYCGSVQTLSKTKDDVTVNMFNRANNIRLKNDFDKAREIYEKILDEDNTNSEANWGIVLCEYGIEYVEDPKTYERIPTCHRAHVESVLTDPYYLAAVENADLSQKEIYQKEAKRIAELQKEILDISSKEEPFDVFICYKETDEHGKRTQDSAIANDVYYALKDKGYKVFYAAITLEDKLGSAYEPYIFAALNSAKVMLVIGTKPEYFEAVWVKNEWSRFLGLMKEDRTRTLIPCYRNMSAYDLPEEFAHLQAQDMGKVAFMIDLIRGIEKLTPKQVEKSLQDRERKHADNFEVNARGAAASESSLLKRAFMFLEDGDWKNAQEYCEKVLDIDPENARAYLGKLMAKLHVNKEQELGNLTETFSDDADFKHVLEFSDGNYKKVMLSYIEKIDARNKRKELEKKNAVEEHIKKYNSMKSDLNFARSLISVGNEHVVGVEDTGTVCAEGSNLNGQCNVRSWSNIISVAAGWYHTVGLKADGAVVAVCNLKTELDGRYYNKQCDVEQWSDIVQIDAYGNYTVGLKRDGTVVVTGEYFVGMDSVSKWNQIVKVSAGCECITGLRSDGTVVSTNRWYIENYFNDESDIVDIAVLSKDDIYLLKSDGRVVTGDKYRQERVSTWNDIVAIAADFSVVLGLKSDGTVVIYFTSSNPNEGKQLCKNVCSWKNIISIDVCNGYVLGLKSDGSLECCSKTSDEKRNVLTWKLFGKISDCRKNFETNRERLSRQSKGVCQYCGGNFKGIFNKVCTNCGRKKDYYYVR